MGGFEYNRAVCGDALRVLPELPEGAFDVCLTSPTYWGMRDYGPRGQIGPQEDPAEWVRLVAGAMDRVRRCLAEDGLAWVVVGDCYSGSGGVSRAKEASGRDHYSIDPRGEGVAGHRSSPVSKRHGHGRRFDVPWKSRMLMPHRLALELVSRGWVLRQEVVWHKPNHLPAHVEDRPKTRTERVLMLSSSGDYYWDYDASRVDAAGGGFKAPDDLWEVPIDTSGRHDASFPEALAERCLAPSLPPGGALLDPFCGSGTSLAVAASMGADWFGIDIVPSFAREAEERAREAAPSRAARGP